MFDGATSLQIFKLYAEKVVTIGSGGRAATKNVFLMMLKVPAMQISKIDNSLAVGSIDHSCNGCRIDRNCWHVQRCKMPNLSPRKSLKRPHF